MIYLPNGQFYGQTNEIIHLGGLTLTDTEYTHDKVDWHYHENAYFTFILDGKVLEGNKKEVYQCTAGSLLFHNWEDAHYNIKPAGFTRGFHIELEHNWFSKFEIDPNVMQGSISLSDPAVKILMYNLFKETKLDERTRSLAVDSLLVEIFNRMGAIKPDGSKKTPVWVSKIRGILQDLPSEDWTLYGLSQTLGIHPVHLSRDFTKYFHCNLSEYIRSIKIQRSLSLLPDLKHSLTDIAFECGFADQSHFIRSFKALNSINPARYRKLLQR